MPISTENPDQRSAPSRDLKYFPFSYEFPQIKLPEKSRFQQNYSEEYRQWFDSLSSPQLAGFAYNFIGAIVNKFHTKEPFGTDIILTIIADQALSAVHHVALSGSSIAARQIALILTRAVDQINHENADNSNIMKKVAASQIKWPVNHSPVKPFRTDINLLQQRLKIGDDYLLKIKSKGQKQQYRSFNFDVPKNRVVWRMIETLQMNRHSNHDVGPKDLPSWVIECRELPPLNKESARKWAEVGWKAICEAYHDHPENDPILRSIGKNRSDRSKTDKAAETAIRSEIKTEIFSTFKKLAKAK